MSTHTDSSGTDSITNAPAAAPHDYLRKGEPPSPHTSALAGALAGLISRNAIAPIDTVKIRLQVRPVLRKARAHPSGEGAAPGQPPKTITQHSPRPLARAWRSAALSECRQILQHEGPRAFWKGNVPGSAMYVVYNAVQFASYSYCNAALAPYTGGSQKLHSAACGALAGCAAAVASYPCDVLRTRFAANSGPRLLGLAEGVRAVWHHEGPLGFFRGSATACCSVGLATGLIFGTYESVRILAEEGAARSQAGAGAGVGGYAPAAYTALGHLASPLSGLVSKLATFPLDTVRRRIVLKDSAQLHLVARGADSAAVQEYLGRHARLESRLHVPELGAFWRVAAQLWRHEGPAALYRGLSMALLKSVPSTAVTLWSYEWLMRGLSRGPSVP